MIKECCKATAITQVIHINMGWPGLRWHRIKNHPSCMHMVRCSWLECFLGSSHRHSYYHEACRLALPQGTNLCGHWQWVIPEATCSHPRMGNWSLPGSRGLYPCASSSTRTMGSVDSNTLRKYHHAPNTSPLHLSNILSFLYILSIVMLIWDWN